MTVNQDHSAVIIAGSSGLVGSELMKQLLDNSSIKTIYALVRKPPVFQSSKLVSIISPTLQVDTWNAKQVHPTLGFICLGSTLKQAGSKQALEKIDYELVCKVALEMKNLGVEKIAVVSSIGASLRSFSHYLRCKGKMEHAIRELGFRHVTFVRPGPLMGLRETPRYSETVTNAILRVLRPLLIGPLRNLSPIAASEVAQAMYLSVFQDAAPQVVIYRSADIKARLKSGQ